MEDIDVLTPAGGPAPRLYDDIYTPEVLMARAGHLDRGRRQDLERITRIIRERGRGAASSSSKGGIAQIRLIGPYASYNWTQDDAPAGIPVYDMWIIGRDPRRADTTRWQALELQIALELGNRCRVRLSFTASEVVKAGRREGKAAIIDQLEASILLFHAKRDDPQHRRGRGAAGWYEALLRFDATEADFAPAQEAFRNAERAYFAIPADQRSPDTSDTDPRREAEAGLADAIVRQRALGDRRHHAVITLLHMPAPSLAAIICKLELVCREGDGDDHVIRSILADVRWIAARLARQRRYW